ncbi:hypothetical protein H2202_004530 [Exophiala xenobiotica]|nr:hypothetical protein H2202_004530 [Exophiala xenobiotica]KAK5218570.1 hypothetical protein LTR72_008509 [Exophiala xenobiotica]KAK5222553.1 hypothetical protein LTR47_010456 [Exophiala xenobiotica]KAK5252374.1 hypothetical protein LTS06_003011 [Exophiala xenobiotica]KAK5290454.1 hypothetical protein LTR14_006757 [Exophiala xenobiotica]
MCFNCAWPWHRPLQLAAEPVKQEYIFLDDNVEFYEDRRTAFLTFLFTLLFLAPLSHRPLRTPPHLHLAPLGAINAPIMPNYYNYQSLYPSSLNDPRNAGHWENPADWPRTFYYVSADGTQQGIHPPAPVYQSNQPAQQRMYYFAGGSSAPAGYYMNGLYHGASAPAATSGWPYTCYPYSSTPAASSFCAAYGYSPYHTAPQSYSYPMTGMAPWMQTSAPAQAAAAVAANATLQQMPNAPAFFVGATSAEMQAQNAILAANLAAGQSQPTMLAPYKPGSSPQFWCKELDGSWTLREYNDTLKSDFPPGRWERHGTSGYYYYVRHSS